MHPARALLGGIAALTIGTSAASQTQDRLGVVVTSTVVGISTPEITADVPVPASVQAMGQPTTRPLTFGAMLPDDPRPAPVTAQQTLIRAAARPELFAVPPPTLEGFRPLQRPLHMLRYPVTVQSGAPWRPQARDLFMPDARWDHRPDGDDWTRATLAALNRNAPGLIDIVPRDIDTWCPAYRQNSEARRRAFWVGLMSALAWQESRHDPRAVGGDDQWYGLMQIYPPTARGYECRATTGAGLTNPLDNLSCATRILAVTVPRDNAIAVYDGRWRGVAADWGPMVSDRKRGEMIAWVRQQDYCTQQLLSAPRPPSRPGDLAAELAPRVSTQNLPQSLALADE